MIAATGISIAFDRPLLLAALAGAALPLLVAAWGKRRGRLDEARRGPLGGARHGREAPRWAVVMQCLAVALVAMALAAPRLTGVGRSRLGWLVMTDVSASARGQSDRPVGFGDDRPVQRLEFAASVGAPGQVTDVSATNIAGPLRLAAARATDGRIAGVVIRTDGQFADTNWQPAARALGEAGVAVAVVPFDSPPDDARIVDISAARGRGEAVELRVTVAAGAADRRTLTVQRLWPSAAALLTRPLTLLAGDVMTIRINDEAPVGNAARYTADLSAGDAWGENDAASAMVLPRVRRAMLVSDDASRWRDELARQTSMEVASRRPADAPASETDLAEYVAVIVMDPSGDGLTPPQREAIGRYVRSGGGLVLVGSGPRGSPADRDDPLNQVAALVANPYDRSPLAVTVVLDASGSMSLATGGSMSLATGGSMSLATGGSMAQAAHGRPRFAQAAEATIALRRYLTEQDSLKVITFSDEPKLTYDSGDVPADFAALGEALRGVTPAGPTRAGAALELAASTPDQPGRRRLIILVSDLMTEPFDVPAAAEALTAADASLAVVATGRADDDSGAELLAALASAIDGPLVSLEPDADLSQLSEIFGRFVRHARGGAVRRGAFGSIGLTSLPGAEGIALPPLDAYILSATSGEDVEVYARVAGDPVLALRRAGLGRSATLAVPLGNGDNAAWLRSPAPARLLATLTEWSARPPADGRFLAELAREGGHIRVRLDAARDGRLDAADGGVPMNGLELTMTVVADSAQPASYDMHQVAPGRYEATLPAGQEATWLAVADDDGVVVCQKGIGGGCAAEFVGIGPDWPRLRELARLTGGRIAPGQALLLDEELVPRGALTLWPAGLAAGLAMMLIEWLAVRVRRPAI